MERSPGFSSIAIGEIRDELLEVTPERMELLEMAVHSIQSVPSLFQIIRSPANDRIVYYSGLTSPFQSCSGY
jgi:hypothetical protein